MKKCVCFLKDSYLGCRWWRRCAAGMWVRDLPMIAYDGVVAEPVYSTKTSIHGLSTQRWQLIHNDLVCLVRSAPYVSWLYGQEVYGGVISDHRQDLLFGHHTKYQDVCLLCQDKCSAKLGCHFRLFVSKEMIVLHFLFLPEQLEKVLNSVNNLFSGFPYQMRWNLISF